MTKHLTIASILAFALASTALASAQEKEKEKPAPAAKSANTPNPTPLKVQVVIGRYQGEKKLSSMPYLLTMSANNRATLRMGAKIPVPVTTIAQNANAPVMSSFNYQDVGTNIDCGSTALEDGRFLLALTVDDSSVYPDDQSAGVKGNPSFRSFRATNTMILRHGETGQFTAATDKVTGETVKVDVTLTVLK